MLFVLAEQRHLRSKAAARPHRRWEVQAQEVDHGNRRLETAWITALYSVCCIDTMALWTIVAICVIVGLASWDTKCLSSVDHINHTIKYPELSLFRASCPSVHPLSPISDSAPAAATGASWQCIDKMSPLSDVRYNRLWGLINFADIFLIDLSMLCYEMWN